MNSLPKPSKDQLRATLRQRRQSLSPNTQADAAHAVATLAVSLQAWKDAKRVALYHAADGEIDTGDIAKLCHKQGKSIFLPVIGLDMHMVFARWREGDKLVRNRFGILEPGTTESSPEPSLCPAAELDILFMPLVGWDKKGGRLGMGAGYYDRVLAGVSGPALVGLAHRIQEVDEIPQDGWDVSLDTVITDEAVHQCRK